MTTDALSYGLPEPDERATLEALLSQALQFPPDTMRWWVDHIGMQNFRVLRERDRIVAGVGLLAMAQWLGGRAVGEAGITTVGVALDRRGAGVGAALMQRTLAELHTAGVPLAALHPSSLAFYRSVGFERAGTRLSFEAPLHTLAGPRPLEVEPVAPMDYAELKSIYSRYAARTHGALDRPPFVWDRALTPPDTTVSAYRLGPAAAPEGYVVLAQGGHGEPLRIRDMCLLSAAAGHTVQALVAGQRTMADRVAWNGAPNDRLALLARYRPPTVTGMHDWMLRLVDVPAALAQRGYPSAVAGELHVELRDTVLRPNAGRFILAVENGLADVQPGGSGALQLDVRDLAALYSGHLAPATLEVVGGLAGDADSLALATALFCGGTPSMADMF